MIFRILFFSFSDVNVRFAETEGFTKKNYIAATALLTTKKGKFINKRKFAAATMDKKAGTFAVDVAAFPATSIHPSKKA